MTGGLTAPAAATPASPPPVLHRLFGANFRDVWTWLGALGVSADEIHDAVLEVFLSTQSAFEGSAGPTCTRPGLFDLTVRVALSRVPEAQASNDADGASPGRPLSLHRLLAPLAERDRVVFRLYELGGLSCAQIAKLMETSTAQVRARLESARGRCEVPTVTAKAQRDPQRLLSPTATTPRPLRAALQSALPSPPSSLDEDRVAFELHHALSAQRDGARISHVAVLRRPG
jgi:DNA-directed RNA polymerase specialized sigma24 family protein